MTFYSSAESMNLVAEGKYAYIYFKSNLESIVNTQYTTSTGETNLHIAAEEFFPGGYGWAFPKVRFLMILVRIKIHVITFKTSKT